MRDQIFTRKEIISRIRQQILNPEEALEDYKRAGHSLNKEEEKKVLEIFFAFQNGEIETVDQAIKELREEGLYEKEKFCCQT